ncbi:MULTISPECIES: CdaR family transcriptional regulator [unclassified Burkholderia]|nr:MULTISPECIES: helix-turn-helix domain-containing protein [unclassified Burkholderia]
MRAGQGAVSMVSVRGRRENWKIRQCDCRYSQRDRSRSCRRQANPRYFRLRRHSTALCLSIPLRPKPTMPVIVPTLSSRLRDKLAELADDRAVIVESAYAILMKLEGYRDLAPTVRNDIFETMSLQTDLCLRSLLTGKPCSAEVIDALQESARRRVHQNVPLQSILRAYQLGAREIWRVSAEVGRADPALAEELLFDVSPYLFDFFDEQAQITAQAYLAEQHQQAWWRESLLHQFRDVIFHASGDAAMFAELAAALGLDATSPRVALAIDADLRDLPPVVRYDELERLVLIAARHLDVAREALVHAWHRERLVIWVPCTRGDTLSRCDQIVAERAARLVGAEPRMRNIGIGLMNHGADGWAASVTEALKAVDFAPRDGQSRRIHRYSSMAIEESVRGTPNVLRYLVSLIEQLSGEADLIATLAAYFESGQRRRVTAERLNIHPNTLIHRLERIETVLGASLDDPGWIAQLDIALKLRHATSGCAAPEPTEAEPKPRRGRASAK